MKFWDDAAIEMAEDLRHSLENEGSHVSVQTESGIATPESISVIANVLKRDAKGDIPSTPLRNMRSFDELLQICSQA